MIYLDNVIELILLFAAGLISPGPDFVLIIKYSLSYSKRTGLLASLGIATGALIHAVYILFGVGAIIAASPFLMQFMYIGGGAYLCYLGYSSVITKTKSISTESYEIKNDLKPSKAFFTGLLTCILNPKAIFFITAIMTSVIDPKDQDTTSLLYLFIIFLETLLWYSIVVYFLSLPKIRNKARSIEIWISKATGTILLIFGAKLILEGIAHYY
ncbi:MAG UNVERIFIED_CONTAM: LysE family transporter [Rickettsiaceae bacterium]|jgi:RhtB (resistance to homoserine/threonine) family protein